MLYCDRFFNGEITDLALIHSLSALKLGKQYVALTERACKKIKILDEQGLSEANRDKLKKKVKQTVQKASPWQTKFAGNIAVKAVTLMN